MGTKGSKQSGASKQEGEPKQKETTTTSDQQVPIQSPTMANNGDFVEAVVAKASEVPDGQ